ncbi:MAG: hypothetical protein ABIN37_14725 [Burkholderiaceae bacterium]
MKRCPLLSQVFCLVMFGAAACAPALAQHYGRGYSQGGTVYYSRHDGVHLGISLAVPRYAPRYYASPNYYYPAYAYPASAYSYPAPVYSYSAPVYSYPAPAYSYPAPAYSYPAPVYSYPTPAYSYPAPVYANPPPLPPVAQLQQSEGQGPMAPPKAQADRYYCAESDAYYPNVTSCADGWQRMSAQQPISR